ncbi:carboxymuconolactone decarboxylase family protein [Dyadobacter sp. CY107]|uniref:carboxymuconolactone decarboxylase family protein n=1 Tax=Dyadobacter fanqingshengii TaxID=2906443 RepID=UPI001F4491F2|nr:carboxymuconolactone decarboxylase family protein [Dyadobacter fanqingshengii]MCF2506870.1 carboxymuconolactone decarboxylase family protein [Dyadobacter fanqingshengii]
MPHIPLPEHLPGITGLLEYNKETAAPIRELTQFILRGESTLTPGERELIATIVSHNNECKFCTAAHTAAADLLIGNTETCEIMKQDIDATPVSDKMKALLKISRQVQVSGKAVTPEAIATAKDNGATDIEIHDTVLIAALFCLYNRYVDGMATIAPSNPDFYKGLGQRLVDNGYNRLANGYDHLKQQKQPS